MRNGVALLSLSRIVTPPPILIILSDLLFIKMFAPYQLYILLKFVVNSGPKNTCLTLGAGTSFTYFTILGVTSANHFLPTNLLCDTVSIIVTLP